MVERLVVVQFIWVRFPVFTPYQKKPFNLKDRVQEYDPWSFSSILKKAKDAKIAPKVERWIENPQVTGSTPVLCTIIPE